MAGGEIKREASLDFIRFIAAFFVIGVHFSLHNYYYEARMSGLSMLLQSILRQMFHICVPLFLMLTGYLQNKKKATKSFYLALAPILGLYLLYSLGAILVRQFVFGEIRGIKEWIRLTLAFKANEYGWYIEMYIGLFLMIPFLNVLYGGLRGKREKLVLIGTALFILAVPAFFNNFNIIIFQDWWIYAYPIQYYFLGAFINEYRPKFSKAALAALFALLTLGAGVLNYAYSRGGEFRDAIGDYGSIWVAAQAAAAFLILYDIKFKGRLIPAATKAIALLSLDIYLGSYITDKLMYAIGQRVWFVNNSQFLKYMPIMVGGSFLFALALAIIRKAAARQFKRRAPAAAAVFLIIILVAGQFIFGSETAVSSKIKDNVARTLMEGRPNEREGLESAAGEEEREGAKLIYSQNAVRLINMADGYQIDLPPDTRFDFDYAPLFTKVWIGGAAIVISAETSPYEDVDEYIRHYLNRFITDERYQRENGISLFENTAKRLGDNTMRIIGARLENAAEAEYDSYRFATVNTPTRDFYRILMKCRGGDEGFWEMCDEILATFKFFKKEGAAEYSLNFYPKIPKGLSYETKAAYLDFLSGDKLKWGIFTKDIYGEGIEETIPALEKSLNFKFGIILSYLHFGDKFPVDFMRQNYNDGRIVELTYQMTTTNNEKLMGYTPCLDVYRGVMDDEIRAFARGAKEFGRPFLFRLNNEMNSDWTSYSGVVTMSDPEIYISNWRRFYRIFEEEGANNAIWVFNPNDRNFPPCKWNNFAAYYPGNDYVQMLGVTGYNNGTYYAKENSEEWREFEEIYDEISKSYKPLFSRFPWIVTEFSSSSIGGDKVKWINNMFSALHKYPEIKAAVWFSYADFDPRPERAGAVSRPYWIDETKETLDAFAKGLKEGM